jgi:hypothetical protein
MWWGTWRALAHGMLASVASAGDRLVDDEREHVHYMVDKVCEHWYTTWVDSCGEHTGPL